jgi:hypothetical protein
VRETVCVFFVVEGFSALTSRFMEVPHNYNQLLATVSSHETNNRPRSHTMPMGAQDGSSGNSLSASLTDAPTQKRSTT